jgi:amidase
MDRRTFLAVGASTPWVGAVPSCLPAASAPRPRPAAPGGIAWPAAPHAELEEASLADLTGRMARGELTAQVLVEQYLARIEAIDRAGPALRSVLETNPDAIAIAARLDDERRARGPRGPLHGIPVLLKDNVDTGDRMQTTAGSLALVGPPAPRDAHLVTRLRSAGAVVLGKTNLSEWANIRDAHSTSGWSARGGLTRNPYALDRNTSGSSSGSAAAVAASLCAIAVGTETNGSILSPSQIQGLVGIKPTVGLVSRAGIIPISHTQDTAGPMARTVADAACLLGAMAGADPYDPATGGARVASDYGAALRLDGARGKRVGVLRPAWMGPAVKTSFEAAVDVMKRLGAVVIDVELPKSVADSDEPELTVLLHELKVGMAAYLGVRAHPAHRCIEDLIRFNGAHASAELAVFGQDLFEKAAATRGLDAPEYTRALATCRRISREEGIDALLAAHALEALVAPTGGPAWLTDFVNGDSFTGAGYALAAIAGYPSITVPCGGTHGLPLGVCLMGAAWSEARLLAIAYAFEQATRLRSPPTYPPSADAPAVLAHATDARPSPSHGSAP